MEGRIAAVARAQSLLAEGHWQGADLRTLLEGSLSAFLGNAPEGTAARVRLDGPAALLAAPATQPLSMAVHELATNATKYGALSVEDGRVAVSWRVDSDAGLLGGNEWSDNGNGTWTSTAATQHFGPLELYLMGYLPPDSVGAATVLYDGLVLLVATLFADWPLETPMLVLSLLNPVDLARVLLLLSVDVAALMGYTGAVFERFFGGAFGLTVAGVALVTWAALPFLLGLRGFSRKDF